MNLFAKLDKRSSTTKTVQVVMKQVSRDLFIRSANCSTGLGAPRRKTYALFTGKSCKTDFRVGIDSVSATVGCLFNLNCNANANPTKGLAGPTEIPELISAIISSAAALVSVGCRWNKDRLRPHFSVVGAHVFV